MNGRNACLMLAAVFAAGTAFAGRTCTWTGAKNNLWSDPDNWADGEVPGVFWDGEGTPGYPTGDVAVFGASSVTTIDCTGLYSILKVKITGADAPAYTFTTTDDWTAIPLEPNGEIYIGSDVVNDQTLSVTALANLAKQYSPDWTNSAACFGSSTYIRNYSTNTLHFTRFDAMRVRPGNPTGWRNTYMYFYGSGAFDFSGSFGALGGTSPEIYFNQTCAVHVNCDVMGLCHLTAYNTMTVNIAEGCTLGTSPTINSPTVVASSGTLTINGPGLLSLGENRSAVSLDRRGYLSAVSSTARLEINCPVVSAPSGGTIGCVHVYNSAGTVVFNTPSNAIPGSVDVGQDCQGTVVFPSTNNLGTVTGFTFGSTKNGGTVRFDGADEEALVLPLVYTTGVRAVVKNGGTGTLTVSGAISAGKPSGYDATAEFCGDAGRIVFAPTFGAATPKTFRFSGASGVAMGRTTAAALPTGAGLELDGGTTLCLSDAGAYALPALVNVAGANTLAIADGAQVALAGVTLTAGTLDLVYDVRQTTVTLTGKNPGDAFAGLTVNGEAVGFGAGGRVLQNPTAVDATIAAKGDQVPNDATKTVGVTTEGTGANTSLAADATAVKALVNQQTAAATIAVGAGQTLTADEVAIDAAAGDFTIGETAGTGTLAVKTLRNTDAESTLTVNAGMKDGAFTATGRGAKKIRLAGAQTVGAIALAGGTTTFEGALLAAPAAGADIVVTNGAKLVFGAGTGFVAADGSPTMSSGAIRLGAQGAGVLQIEPGAIVSNRIVTGHATGVPDMIAAVYLRGGDVFPCTTNTQSWGNGFFGKNIHGYYGIHGGTLTVRGNYSFPSGDGQAFGLITQTGGRFVDLRGSGAFRFAQGSSNQTAWYFCGGTADVRGINLGDWGGYNNYTGVITVDGTADLTARSIQAAYWNTKSARSGLRVMLNVNGGVIRANGITRNGYTYQMDVAAQRRDDRCYVNFDGGTFQVTNAGYVFGNDAETSHVDRVTLFARGARFDTNGKSPEVAVPLQAPTGKGVKAVVWNDELTGLVAPPVVKIVDPTGAGEGASAYALLDEEAGKVTNIVVTSRGWGYGAGTKAKIQYGYWNNAIEVPVTLEDAVSGGLTVCGGGTLQLARTNTYTGATCATNATIKLKCDDAIASASKLVLEKGGVLDLNGHAQTFADVETRGGTVANGKPRVSGVTVDFAAAAAGAVKNYDLACFDFTADAELTLLNFDPATLDDARRYVLATFTAKPALDVSAVQAVLPPTWKIVVGATLRLAPNNGTTLIFR